MYKCLELNHFQGTYANDLVNWDSMAQVNVES